MPVSRDNQKSLEAIRLRAQALASSSQESDCTGEAETLAAFADGVLSFSEVDNAALDACIETLGADRFIDAVSAPAPESENKRTRPVRSWYRQKLWLATAASLAIVASGVFYYSKPKAGEVRPVQSTAATSFKPAPTLPQAPVSNAPRTQGVMAQRHAPAVHPAPEVKLASATPPAASAPDSASAIRDALAAKYLRNPAQIVVLQKGQMWMTGPVQNTYENGRISHNLMAPAGFGKLPMSARARTGRFAMPGERMKVRNIYADDDGIIFEVATDDAPGSQYQAFIGFPFDEGTKPSADQVGRDVADVFTVERRPTTLVALGRTIDEETGILGEPRKIFVVGAKSIFLYDRTKVTFIEGIVSSIQKVTPASTAEAGVLGPKKVSP